MTHNQITALGTKYLNLKGSNRRIWKRVAEEVEANGFDKINPAVYGQMFRGTQMPKNLKLHHLEAIRILKRYVKQGHKYADN